LIDILKKSSIERSKTINIIICIIVLLSVLIVPSVINSYVSLIIKNTIYTFLLFILYYKDLIKEFDSTKKNIKKDLKKTFRYYLIGLICMMIFNYLIDLLLNSISDNETTVRNILFNNPFIYMFNVSIIAPIEEEIIFRHSVRTIFNNRIIYSLCSGFLFAFSHLMINIFSNSLVLSDLLYIFPYMSLGVSFALMVYDTKSTFTSIIYHSIHNTIVALLLIISYLNGVL